MVKSQESHVAKRVRGSKSDNMGCFKEVFLEQYFPWIIRKNKAQEFADLVQGSMTIEQYQVKFIELSHFAPYLIPNEISKA